MRGGVGIIKCIKNLTYNILKENGMDMVKVVGNLGEEETLSNFMRRFIGKRLKDLLDIGSFSRLYLRNRYDFEIRDDADMMVVMSDLWDAVVNYINSRKVRPLKVKLDAVEAEDLRRPEVIDYNHRRADIFRSIIKAEREGNVELVKKLRSEKNALEDENPSRHMKNSADFSVLVREIQSGKLTLDDVSEPTSEESEIDRKNWKNLEEKFLEFKEKRFGEERKDIGEEFKLKNHIRRIIEEILA